MDESFIFRIFRPFRREEDGKLTTFQDRFIKILEGARRDTHVNKTNLELYERLKEKKNDLKDNADITSQWERELLQSGLSRSDEVINKIILLAIIAAISLIRILKLLIVIFTRSCLGNGKIISFSLHSLPARGLRQELSAKEHSF